MRNELRISETLVPPGSTVLCAVSGGADSVCLLSLCAERGDLKVLCAHYDHGIRGEESRRDALFTEELCRRMNIPFFTARGDVPALAAQRGQGLEEAAREARYAFLLHTAAEQKADLILTAHTMNDNAETVLLNLARGTGARGLCGIPTRRDNIVRPLLGVTRSQIESRLRERGISWMEDSTNASDDYARNRARHRALPAMEELHPGALRSIARMTENLREDEDCLASLADDFLSAQREPGVDAAALCALPPAVSRRVLRRWTGWDLSRERTDEVLSLCRSEDPSAGLDLPGGRLERRYDRLVLASPPPPSLPERTIEAGSTIFLPEAGLTLECLPAEKAEIQKTFTTFFFSCDKICGKLNVGPRREGDSIVLRSRTGRRSLKKLLQEARIPREFRDTIPVLRDEQGVLAVYGIGQAARSFSEGPYLRLRFITGPNGPSKGVPSP